MNVLHGYDHVPPGARGAAIALGNFDGVHRGHQALLQTAIEAARTDGTPSAAMVFDPHPREHFHPERPHFRLTSLERRIALMEAFGVDFVTVVPFDARLAGYSAEDFVDRVLVAGLGVAHVVVGYDFYFGKCRGGDVAYMRRRGDDSGFAVSIVPPIAVDGEVISSSGIRSRLAQGDVRGAAEWLGTWWSIDGVVTGGAKRGTGMGYPTANITMHPGTALAHGIYAVRVGIGRERFDGAAYLGTRPTFDNGRPVLEIFLLEFDGNLYGRNIDVEFIERIREDRRFDRPEALVRQMDADCAEARRILRQTAEADPMLGHAMGRALLGQRTG